MLGYYDKRKLRFAWKVKAGFVAHARREPFRKLQRLRVDACPLAHHQRGCGRLHAVRGARRSMRPSAR